MRLLSRHRVWQAAVDAGLVVGAWYLAFWLRFDAGIPAPYGRLFEQSIYIVAPIKLAIFVLFGFYSHWWRYVSIRDMWALVRGVTVATIVAEFVVYLADPVAGFRVPRSVLVLDWLVLLGLVAGARLLARTIIERPGPRSLVARGKEALVVGAGDAGQLIIKEMLRNVSFGYTPIGAVEAKPMFGGYGFYFEGMIFALEAYGKIWLKVDTETRARFEAAGSEPFLYEGRTRMIEMPYWTLPDEALRGGAALKRWVGLALEVARRASARKRPTARRCSQPEPDFI